MKRRGSACEGGGHIRTAVVERRLARDKHCHSQRSTCSCDCMPSRKSECMISPELDLGVNLPHQSQVDTDR